MACERECQELRDENARLRSALSELRERAKVRRAPATGTRATKRDYFRKSGTASYRDVLHDENDERRKRGHEIRLPRGMLSRFPDGAVVEITVRDTGTRHAGTFRHTKPGTYEKVMDTEEQPDG